MTKHLRENFTGTQEFMKSIQLFNELMNVEKITYDALDECKCFTLYLIHSYTIATAATNKKSITPTVK